MKALLEDEALVTLGDGSPYTVAALSLDGVIEAESHIEDLNSGDARKARDAAVAIVGMALKRRHPDITPEQIGGLLNLKILGGVIRTVLHVSGMIRDEAEPSGEAQGQR